MKEYRFSTKYGVEGDAGAQGSYHGLKHCISDEFLVMGKKRLTYVNSASVYEGEGPYYFFTTVNMDKAASVKLEVGSYKPEKIWVDHQEISSDEIYLSEGRHYFLLRFAQGGRSYFVIKKSDSFKQSAPLTTNWYKNTDVVPFDALYEKAESLCRYRFTAPPGATLMKIDANAPIKAYVDGRELQELTEGVFAINTDRAVQVTLCAKQPAGCYDTAIFNSPIKFETDIGIYSFDRTPDEQGLDFYSGGLRLKKKITARNNGKRKFFEANTDFGCAIEVLVNNTLVSTLLTQPYRCEITQYLTDGENDIEIRAYNTPHNHMKTIPTNYNAPIAKAPRPKIKDLD